jgi:hypothetical protein
MDGVGRIDTGGIVDREGEAAGNGRSKKRDSLLLTAQIRFAGDATVHTARVRNLSAGGLMAEIDHPAEPGTPVTLELRGIGAVTGSVAWSTRGRLGIALDVAVDPSRARTPVGTGGATPAYAKPLVVTARRR